MVITLIPGGLAQLGLGGPGQGVVAKVAGDRSPRLEVQREAAAMLRQQFPQGGAQTAMLLPYFAAARRAEPDQPEGHRRGSRTLGLRATDDEVRDELQHGRYSATLFPGGKFIGQKQYESLLQHADLTVPDVRAGRERTDPAATSCETWSTGSALVTDAEVRQEFEKQNTKVKFEYAVLRKDDLLRGSTRPTRN